jgi:hypothetical protein
MTPGPRLIGFEKDSHLQELLARFGILQDYRTELPGHLLTILRRQQPSVGIESIELLEAPKCGLGGMQKEEGSTIVRVQTLNIPLELRLTLREGASKIELDIQLVINWQGLDATPSATSDMYVKAQRTIA